MSTSLHTKVFVGNLSFKTKAEELAAEFSAAGRVVSANIITRGPRSLGYGFVEMETPDEAQKAVTILNKKSVDSREINVELAKPREDKPPQERPERRSGGGGRGGRRGGRGGGRGGRGGFSGDNNNNTQGGNNNNNNNNQGPAGAVSASAGSSNVPREQGQGGRRFPRRRFRGGSRGGGPGGDGQGGNRGDGNQSGGAPNNNNNNNNNSNRGEGASGPRGGGPPRRRRAPRREFTNRTPSATTLFVANLPFGLDDEGLSKLFKDQKVTKAHVVKNRNGRSKGFGFVEFDNEADQKTALDASSKLSAEGRELIVKIALTAPEISKDAAPANAPPPAAAKDAQPASKSDEKSS